MLRLRDVEVGTIAYTRIRRQSASFLHEDALCRGPEQLAGIDRVQNYALQVTHTATPMPGNGCQSKDRMRLGHKIWMSKSEEREEVQASG